MARRQARSPDQIGRTCKRGRRPRHFPKPSLSLAPIGRADRKALLLGTALASTFLIGSVLAPTPAMAVDCPQTPGQPISYSSADPITCVNTEPRTNAAGDAIYLNTNGDGSFIELDNGFTLDATDTANFMSAVFAFTEGYNSPIVITNNGAATATNTGQGNAFTLRAVVYERDARATIVNSGELRAYSIEAVAIGLDAEAGDLITIENSGAITADGFSSLGIRAFGPASVHIENTGDIVATGEQFAGGIEANSFLPGGVIDVENHGKIDATATDFFGRVRGIYLNPSSTDVAVVLVNSGDITATGTNDDVVAVHVDANFSNNPVTITNSGAFIASGFEDTDGIYVTGGVFSPVDIVNSGDMAVSSTLYDARGIVVFTSTSSRLAIENSGDIVANADRTAMAISAATNATSPISIENRGDLTAVSSVRYSLGIFAGSGGNSPISIENDGDVTSEALLVAFGMQALAGADSPISVENRGDIAAKADDRALGISVRTSGASSSVAIRNSGDIDVTAGTEGIAISATAYGQGSSIRIENSGDLGVRATDDFTFIAGIFAQTVFTANNRPIDIVNRGSIDSDGAGIIASNLPDGAASAGSFNPISIANHAAIRSVGDGISAVTNSASSGVTIVNTGDVVTGEGTYYSVGHGFFAYTIGPNSRIALVNEGAIDTARGAGLYARSLGAGNQIEITNSGSIKSVGDGIFAIAAGTASAISIINAGDVDASAGEFFTGDAIFALTLGRNSPIAIVNAGNITGEDNGIDARAVGAGSPISIRNSGNVFASGPYSTAVYAFSLISDITIVNSGEISAGSQFAIDTYGASTQIFNTGRITGFVDLTDQPDRFFNQAGGVFETKLVSDFGGGGDLFRNEGGGTVLAATNPGVRETSSFINLERFENRGLISMVDGRVGDTFEISNTIGQEIVFAASGGSTLAVDAFLGGPGSVSDEFIVNGKISGTTLLQVNNTNPGFGASGTVIPVIFANGEVKSDAFFLSQPIDTGFFDYDLFFRPTGSGIFELRSFVGGGALLLPQLVTGAQDIWHQGSSTWFDRTADLRVLLAGGASPTAYNPDGGYAEGAAAGPTAFTPAVWARGSGAWLDRDASETVTAFGRDYRFDLSRDLEVIDWQMGLDLGRRDLLSQGDILVFGLLGGFVGADLDYDQLARNFDFAGGQIGGYATYLRGGLFVDTLLNAHLLELETAAAGFPSSLDANTLGLRTDTGYRFGSFSSGAFIEPLATIAVLWSDIDGFTTGANRVSFDDEANVRGRLGLRAGTSYQAWAGTTVEPFIIGSLWGHLSGDNQATLTSSGTTFRFEDDLDDVWGEVSAGVNFFNPSAGTAVFAKVDVTFGDDVDGIGGKAGMRVSW